MAKNEDAKEFSELGAENLNHLNKFNEFFIKSIFRIKITVFA